MRCILGKRSLLIVLFTFLLSISVIFALECSTTNRGCFNIEGEIVSQGSLSRAEFQYYCGVQEGNAITYPEPDYNSDACSCVQGTSWVESGDEVNCCGDDAADCALITDELTLGIVTDRHLCSMDDNNFGTWYSADNNYGRVVDVYCSDQAFVSNNSHWVPCIENGKINLDSNDYFCNNLTGGWTECCGGSLCNSDKGISLGEIVNVTTPDGVNSGCEPRYLFGQNPDCSIKTGYTEYTNCNGNTIGFISADTNLKCSYVTSGSLPVPQRDSKPVFWDATDAYMLDICTAAGFTHIYNYTFINGPKQDAWHFEVSWKEVETTTVLDSVHCYNKDNPEYEWS